MPTRQKLESLFASTFNADPEGMVKAPGRVCLMGGHTDYNGGFVLPCALDLSTISIFRVRNDKQVRVHSLQYPEYIDNFDLGKEILHCDQRWANYVRGVFHVTRDYGFKLDHGLDLLISSEIPPDSGLASSAALAISVTGSISKALSLPIDKRSLSLIAQKAENDFLGKKCGIMDQLTATMGKPDQMLLIDCEDFSVQPIPFMQDLSIVVINSCARKQLAGNEYNELRRECEQAATTMNVKSLRHATMDLLYSHKDSMNEITFRRARHIISENERVIQISKAITDSNINKLYRLMFESHASMKNDFENSIPEIDAIVDYCHEALDKDVGACMTGGGFGGPVVALCPQKLANSLVKTVTRKYFENFNINATTHVFRPAGGIQISWLS
ncbi:MAG: galactokinase [Gammaproteobacteria bacterium]|nr:galactokinase [Gammaproteobacteria bacterium]